jgi:hypothetical protein
MAIERELCMDTESEEEVSIGDESDKFPSHQESSCSSEDSGDDEEVEHRKNGKNKKCSLGQTNPGNLLVSSV